MGNTEQYLDLAYIEYIIIQNSFTIWDKYKFQNNHETENNYLSQHMNMSHVRKQKILHRNRIFAFHYKKQHGFKVGVYIVRFQTF